jgi:hypothetical protein
MQIEEIKNYQNNIANSLRVIFNENQIQPEWPAIADIKGLYSPRIDIAVGPFATINGISLQYTIKCSKAIAVLLTDYVT